MSALVWDGIGTREFEAGVSKGVLYKEDGFGVPWNGLTSIKEDSPNKVEGIHFDGVKFNDVVIVGDYSGTLRAFTYPEEFLEYEGVHKDDAGFYVGNQPPRRFGLSYQTQVGDDLTPVQSGYKIHVVYNLTAIPSQITYETLSMDVDPIEFEWSISAIPETIDNFNPTAHVIFDTRQMDPYLLQDLEEVLYGSDTEPARLPPLQGLATFIKRWARLIITDLGAGKWEAYSPLPDVITMLDETTFQIVSDTAIFLDPETYEISSSEKEEVDIQWQP